MQTVGYLLFGDHPGGQNIDHDSPCSADDILLLQFCQVFHGRFVMHLRQFLTRPRQRRIESGAVQPNANLLLVEQHFAAKIGFIGFIPPPQVVGEPVRRAAVKIAGR